MSTGTTTDQDRELRARVLAEIRKAPSPTREAHRRRMTLVTVLAIAASAVVFFVMGGLEKGARPVEMVCFTAASAVVAALLLGQMSSPPKGSMLGRPRSQLLVASLVAAPVLAIVAIAAALAWPGPASEDVENRVHLACGAMTFVQGVVPLVALFATRRGTDPVHPSVTGAALGMTAGAWTAMMAYMRCPHAAAMHCVVAHVAPTVVLTMVGAALGAALLRPRA